jgi:hypothetical protein
MQDLIRRGRAVTVRPKALFVIGLFCATLAATVAMHSSAALASSWMGSTAAHGWSSNGVYEPSLGYVYERITAGPAASCVGPVTHNSEGYHFPYGWACGSGKVEWEFATINAAGAVSNPNSSTQWYEAFDGP